MLSDEMIKELNEAKDEIFNNFKGILEGIEMVQDPSKVLKRERHHKLKLFIIFLGK